MLSKRILVLIFAVAFLLLVGCLPSPALPNQAPIITSDPSTTATVGEAYTYDVEATDPDGDTLTYSLAVKPFGMVIDPGTGVISWTPAAKGDYDVVVKVTDGDLDITQSFTITVSKPWTPGPSPTPPKKYTITATAGPGGSISPSGEVKVKKGSDKSFTITPDNPFYSIADVLVDGNSVGAASLYTFNNVTKDHTIHATFAIDTYTITATAGDNGTIDPSGAVEVNHGADQSFTITPDSIFYGIETVSVDGNLVAAVSPYTFTNVTEVHTISVTFVLLGKIYNQDKDEYYNTIQDAIDDASNPSSDTILVMAGTYNERLIINKPLDLRGASNNESVITLAGLPVLNPNILIEIEDGVSNVSVTGFTLIGGPTETNPDEAVVRCWDDNITIEDNIINGYFGVIYKGPGQDLTVHNNHFVVNKDGVVCQSYGASNVTISDNVITLGSNPGGDESAIYMTSCSQSSVTGNTATGFIHNAALAGSNLDNLTVSGNTFTGNAAGVSIWGGSTFITVTDNVLSNSLVTSWPDSGCGICIKGADLVIAGNQIKNNADKGVKIDRHVIDTERVAITDNDISDNSNYGVYVNVVLVSEIVDAENNWWGHESGPWHFTTNIFGTGDTVSDNVDFKPWSTAPNF